MVHIYVCFLKKGEMLCMYFIHCLMVICDWRTSPRDRGPGRAAGEEQDSRVVAVESSRRMCVFFCYLELFVVIIKVV